MLPALLLAAAAATATAAVPVYGFEVVHAWPHDPAAFTEGLFYLDGFLYESTGLEGQSSIRKVQLTTGGIVQRIDIPPQYFGEGIVNWQDHLVSVTWKSQVGFVFDLATLTLQRKFTYQGEGWALTQDGKHLILSDGTSHLRFLDPRTFKETRRVDVTIYGRPLENVNELEWVKGEIFANVWQTNWIVRIDPKDGHVKGLVDLSGLLDPRERPANTDAVLNGIAYDAKEDRLFVTGKYWPKLFEIRLKRRPAEAAKPQGAKPQGAKQPARDAAH
jgi:glutamine cyclotransferase